MPFVIKEPISGKYWKIPKTKYGETKLVDRIDQARVYARQCDVSNSYEANRLQNEGSIVVEVKLVEVS